LIGVYQGNYLRQHAAHAEGLKGIAETQTKITIAAESPIFAFGGFKLAQYAKMNDADPLVDPVRGGIPAGLHQPLVLVSNLGRSPMQLRMFCVESFVGPIVPATPRYQNISTIGHVIRRDENIWVKDYSFYIALSPDDMNKIKNSSGFLWVYGVIRYYNQFTDELIDKGFLLKWNHDQNGGFGWAGLHNYAYDHRQKPRPGYDPPFP
jgi:hypothetical protein